MMKIKKEGSKEAIIQKYEIGLSQLLLKNNFQPYALFNKTIVMNIMNEEYIYQNAINPFIKKSLLRKHSKNFIKLVCKYQFAKFNINYPTSLILKNIKGKVNTNNILNDIVCLRKCILKIHFKEKEIFLFGKKFPADVTDDKSSKFSEFLPFNVQ